MTITVEKINNKETAFIWLTKDDNNIDFKETIKNVKTKYKDYCIFNSGSKDIKQNTKELIINNT
jgi:hypothetical protein